MRKNLAFLIAFLATFGIGGMTLFRHPHPPGGLAARPLPPLERQQPAHYETATFALG
ncbi:hypothetical protein IV102_25830 [bacterium]|nr:hypothetical protein [bacterium]